MGRVGQGQECCWQFPLPSGSFPLLVTRRAQEAQPGEKQGFSCRGGAVQCHVLDLLLCLESQVVSLGSPAFWAARGCFLPFVLSSGFAVVSVSPEALHGVNPNSQALICVACGLAKGTHAVA